MSVMSSVTGAIGTPFTVMGTATRHLADVGIGYGVPSTRYNVREEYRNPEGSGGYNAKQRLGAQIGTAGAVAFPALAAMPFARWAIGGGHAIGGTVGGAHLAAMGVIGGQKLVEMVQDEGNLSPVTTTAGVIGGYMAGSRIGSGIMRPMFGGLGGIAGGVAGHYAGRFIQVGDGHMGEKVPGRSKAHTTFPGTAVDYARGAFNHFTEAGPTSQGISLGYRWGMRESFRTEYSQSERAGAMGGDFVAAAILGGGALAMTARVLNQQSPLLDPAASALPRLTQRVNGLVGGTQALSGHAGARGGFLATAGVLGGVTAWNEYGRFKDAENKALSAGVTAGIAATGVAAGAAAARSAFVQGMAPGTRTAASAMTAAILISALSAARMPVQQFINDARDTWKLNRADTAVAATAGGAGGLAGAAVGYRVASRFADGVPGWKGVAIKVGGTLAATAAGAGAGIGFSATIPGMKQMGIGAGLGAASLGALTLGLTRNGRSATIAAIAGGLLGGSASSVLGTKVVPAPPTTVGEVAGSPETVSR